jgi:hypothetical protein
MLTNWSPAALTLWGGKAHANQRFTSVVSQASQVEVQELSYPSDSWPVALNESMDDRLETAVCIGDPVEVGGGIVSVPILFGGDPHCGARVAKTLCPKNGERVFCRWAYVLDAHNSYAFERFIISEAEFNALKDTGKYKIAE